MKVKKQHVYNKQKNPHSRGKDLTGKKFNLLTAIKFHKICNKSGALIWECLCECGKTTTAHSSRLIFGLKKSCGCLQKLPEGESSINTLYSRYQKSAKERHKSFNLSLGFFKEQIKKNCYYCNSKPLRLFKPKNRNGGVYYNGLDRIDNNEGYLERNVVPCCTDCNLAKGTKTHDDFITYLKRAALHNFYPVKEESLGFESVALKQEKNKVHSRLEVDISSEIIKAIVRPNPLIAANMSTVVNPKFYQLLYRLGAFSFLQRAKSLEERINDIKLVSQNCEWVASSVGIEDYLSIEELIRAGMNVCLIDIAHGYSEDVINLGRKIKQNNPNVKVVVGNTVNVEMLKEVSDFADGLKVGIAQGFACETKNTAGCTEKQFSALLKFKELSKQYGIPIISCGGTREPADVVKAIGAGASSVMMGKIFSACPESAADIAYIDNIPKKVYAGMASEYVQNSWKGGLKPGTCSEGGIRYLDISETVSKVVERYEGALRSGITYAGCSSLKEFQEKVKFIRLV